MAASLFVVTPGLYWKVTVGLILILIPALLWIIDKPNRWILVFLATAWLLPPLPIKLGDSGPHIAILVSLAGLLAGVVRMKSWRFQSDRITGLLLALPVVFLASTASAALFWETAVAAGSLARVVLFSISVYAFFYIRSGPFSVKPAHLKAFIRTGFLCATLSAIFACLDFYFQLPPPAGFAAQFIWLDAGMFRRAQGVFYEASTLGNLCTCFLEMIAVSLFFPGEQRAVPKVFLIIGAFPLISALVLSYSRASALALAIGLALLCWLRVKTLPIRKYLAFAVLFCLIPALLLMRAVPQFAQSYWTRIYNSFAYFGTSPDSILSGRVQSWQTLLTFATAHPWRLFIGSGFKTVPYTELAGTAIVADNTYLSTLIETGIAGFVVLILLNLLILKHSYRASRSTERDESFFGTWMLCFWAGECVQMFSGDLLTYWRVLPGYLCIFALALRLKPGTKSHEAPSHRSIQ